ncbi:MAG: family transcriptional regulator [Herbinix sp.]|jgi:DNA-binding Xre family transcriptional regulator|nr:family transcriptional regulator [Herbinix sp.]
MISYSPLWHTLKIKDETTYTLIHKHNIDPKIVHKLKHNQNVTLQTLERLCLTLHCQIQDIVLISED